VAADLTYVEHSTLAADIGILARTALFVVSGLIDALLHSSRHEEVIGQP
jgi:lipopolysaccharide/colanic/teichoic acid biosynthesis glycosyltransferase